MRVIAGLYGGRRLTAPRGRATRPTSDRVREALFSMLDDVRGTRVLDLFAGTGALAIEALSRGAHSAVVVERDERALKALHANLDALGLGGEQVRVLAMDVATALQSARARAETYDLIFIDPPYRQAHEYFPKLQTALTQLLAPAARVVVESDRRTPLDLKLTLERERRYGDTLIRINTCP